MLNWFYIPNFKERKTKKMSNVTTMQPLEFVFTRGTTPAFRKDVAIQFAIEGARVYVGLKNRQPLIGKFVILDDGEELLRKGLIRFVTKAKEPLFDLDEHVQFTQLLEITVFTEIKTIPIG